VRIAALLSVKDEIELIERSIAHLRAIGVDLTIAVDMYSTDGTAELLRERSSDDDLWFVQMSDRAGQEAWNRRYLELAREADADWVMFLDGDELPVPASGSLKDCASLDGADVLEIDRFNVPLTPDGPAIPDHLVPSTYQNLLLLVATMPFQKSVRRKPDLPWIRTKVFSRIMVRPGTIAGVGIAAHRAVPAGEAPLHLSTPADLLIAHLPFTTRRRFRRKVENVRALLAVHDELFGKWKALHWRRWVALADRGALDEEFDRMIFDGETIAELRDRQEVRSAAALFDQRIAPAGAERA
jgi:hypothetical protein